MQAMYGRSESALVAAAAAIGLGASCVSEYDPAASDRPPFRRRETRLSSFRRCRLKASLRSRQRIRALRKLPGRASDVFVHDWIERHAAPAMTRLDSSLHGGTRVCQ